MNYCDYKGSGIPRFPKDSRVCFVGDSLTSGEGLAGPEGAAKWKTVWMYAMFL